MLLVVSCQKDELPLSYDPSKITVTVSEITMNSATISIYARDIKELGEFSIGICISTEEEPSTQDPHFELNVNSDSLPEIDLDIDCYISDLDKGTLYYVKGYIKTGTGTYYSSQEDFETIGNTFKIIVSSNYVLSGQEYWVVLSDKSTTILTQKLQNNRTYIFTDNIPDLADFHLFRLNTTTTPTRLLVESYVDIVPDEFYLNGPYSSTNVGTVTVTISDVADFLRWGVSSSWWWNSTSLSTTTSLSTGLSKDPDDIFINYLPSNGSAPKYKFVQDVSAYSTHSFTMADLNTMTLYSDIVLPSNLYFTYSIAGYNNNYYTDYIRYHGHSYTAGYPGTFRLYYPSGINSNYYWYSYYNTSNQQSFHNKLGSLPTTFFSAFPDIVINNTSSYVTTSSSVGSYQMYEVMDFCGYYTSSTLQVQWDYYKQPQLENSVQIPEFPNDIKTRIEDLSISDLSFSDVGYFDILDGDVTDYLSYVDLLKKQSSRYYDVIKERKDYYQWESKKSFDRTVKRNGMPEF